MPSCRAAKAAGTVARVSAPEIEQRVLTALNGVSESPEGYNVTLGQDKNPASAQQLIEDRLSRITIYDNQLEITPTADSDPGSATGSRTITLPWSTPKTPRPAQEDLRSGV